MKDFFKKHKIKIGIICASFVISVGGFFALPNDYKVFSKNNSFEIELGSQVDNDISTYIWGIENAVNEAQLDISNVDTFTAGEYEVYVKIGNRTIPYDIKVVDTVAPNLSINQDVRYVAIEREYDVYKFVSEVTDLSNTSDVYFKVNDTLQDTISFDTTGEHTITLVATDISGNETEQSTTINAEVPPKFMGLADTTIPVGANFNYSQSFVIFDETDGFITNTATINDENVDFSKEGTYEITYSVVNSKGIDNSKTIYITTSPDASSDYKYTTNLSSDDWDILINNGYFKYELLEESNTDKESVAELVKPISLNFTKKYSPKAMVAGSAFIYKIEEDYLYGISVKHVISKMTENSELTFYNDVTINTSPKYVHLGSDSELALFRININDIPKETLLTLKEAYLDADYCETLSEGTNLLEFVENHGYNPNLKRVIKSVTLINTNTPNHPEQGFKYPAITTTSMSLGGMSGGPLIDYQGRVFGAISYSSLSKRLDYFMKIDVVDELVQKFNEKYN